MALFNQLDFPGTTASATAGVAERFSSKLPSPWLDPASFEMPAEVSQVYKFCELLWYANGVYQQAMSRIASYFVTKVKVELENKEEEEKWCEFLENDFHALAFLRRCGINRLAYGNLFLSPRHDILRGLTCSCGNTAPLPKWKFDLKGTKFMTGAAGCPICHKRGELQRMDIRSRDSSSIGIRLWDPHALKLKYNALTDKAVYYYTLPQYEASMLRRGDPDFLYTTPWEFVECAISKRSLRIHDDILLHSKEESLAGLTTSGLGLPKAMANFRQSFLMQSYKRLNLVMALEYSMPFRMITPEGGGGELDPTLSGDLGDITGKISALLADWKQDPAAIQIAPIPLRYTAWGGEAMQMATHEQQNQAMEELLNGLGVPVDFYTSSFKSENSFVPTLRLLERSWAELVTAYQDILNWAAKQLSRLLQWEEPKLSLEPTTTANDLELRQILMQLWLQNRVSGKTALKSLGSIDLDINKEVRQMALEQLESQEISDKAYLEQQEKTIGLQNLSTPQDPIAAQQQAQQAQGGAAGGQQAAGPSMPSAGPPSGIMANAPTRPDDIINKAKEIAQQLMSQPEGQRHQPLAQLRQQNELLHSQVIREMDKLRQQMGQQAQQQQGQKQ